MNDYIKNIQAEINNSDAIETKDEEQQEEESTVGESKDDSSDALEDDTAATNDNKDDVVDESEETSEDDVEESESEEGEIDSEEGDDDDKKRKAYNLRKANKELQDQVKKQQDQIEYLARLVSGNQDNQNGGNNGNGESSAELTDEQISDMMFMTPEQQQQYLNNIISNATKGLSEELNNIKQANNISQAISGWNKYHDSVKATDPEYAGSVEFMRSLSREAIARQNPFATPQQIESELERQEVGIVMEIQNSGRDIAQTMKEAAKHNGFEYKEDAKPEPKPEPKNLNEVREQKRRTQNLIGSTTSGKRNMKTKEDILNMSIGDKLKLTQEEWKQAYNS